MINILNKQNKLSETRYSINVTYPRTVNIIHGHYPYPEIIHDFILQIKNNLNDDMNNYTNVKGGMTKWDYFLDKKNFIDLIIGLNHLRFHRLQSDLPLQWPCQQCQKFPGD